MAKIGLYDIVKSTTLESNKSHRHLRLEPLHGDGTNTVAKKGGDGIGYSGHKHQQGEKVIAIIDNNGSILAPLRWHRSIQQIRSCCRKA